MNGYFTKMADNFSTTPLKRCYPPWIPFNTSRRPWGWIQNNEQVSANFDRPGIISDVESFIKSCQVSEETKYWPQPPKWVIATASHSYSSLATCQHLSMDLHYLLTKVMLRFSKAALLEVLPCNYAAYLVLELFSTIICKLHGIPLRIISDRDLYVHKSNLAVFV